ncbi:MAG TPA: hypothetical protein VNF68_09890 [Candidatus Baltobacteraceae bacterium]|nr:hypothetical protein [Candidatus Baltobacteraceae bacterium]
MKKSSSGSRVWLIVVACLILAGTAAYFVGGKVESNAREQQAAVERTKLQNAQNQILTLQSVNQLLTANVWAYRAAYALDNRNFGVANDDAAKVVASLKAVNASDAGVDSNAVATLREGAARIKISVAQNLEAQRAALLHLAAGITKLAEQSETKIGLTR